MARKPRMGRNLNALIHGGSRDRSEKASEAASQSDSPADRPPGRDSAPRQPVARRLNPDDAGTMSPAASESPDASKPSRPLAGDDTASASEDPSDAGAASGVSTERGNVALSEQLHMIGVERIRRGVFQPRRVFDQDALRELADSLQAQGMVQPIVVREFGGAYELIAGERRWRAAQLAGLEMVPAIVRVMDDAAVAAVSLIENIQREDLNPLEEAQALARLCDEFGMTHAAVATSIGRSRTAVSNLMRLLDLHDEVKVLVDKRQLDMGHARALLGAPTASQPAIAERIVAQGLTVRAVEKLVRDLDGDDDSSDGVRGSASDAKPTDPDIERLIEKLSGVLGAGVKIHHKAGGAGRLEIRYGSLEELDGILAHIK